MDGEGMGDRVDRGAVFGDGNGDLVHSGVAFPGE